MISDRYIKMLHAMLTGSVTSLEVFFLTAFHATVHQFGAALLCLVFSLNHEKILVVGYDLRVDGIVRTLAERQKIDGIEEIRLPHAIMPQQAVHLRREVDVGRENILVIDDGDILEYHARKLSIFCKVKPFAGEKRKKSTINFMVWDKMSNFASQKM